MQVSVPTFIASSAFASYRTTSLLAGTAHHPAIESNVTAAALFNFQDAEIFLPTCIGRDIGVLTTLNFEIVIIFVGLHNKPNIELWKNTTVLV